MARKLKIRSAVTMMCVTVMMIPNEGTLCFGGDHLEPAPLMLFEDERVYNSLSRLRSVLELADRTPSDVVINIVTHIDAQTSCIRLHKIGGPLENRDSDFELSIVEAKVANGVKKDNEDKKFELIRNRVAIDKDIGWRILNVWRKVILEARYSMPHPDTGILGGTGKIYHSALFADGQWRGGTEPTFDNGEKLNCLGSACYRLYIHLSSQEHQKEHKESMSEFLGYLTRLEKLYEESDASKKAEPKQ